MEKKKKKENESLSSSYHDLHQWTYENRWTDDTCQSWPIKGYDTGLAEERLTFWRHRKEQGINPDHRSRFTRTTFDHEAELWSSTPRYQSIRARTLDWPPEVEHPPNRFLPPLHDTWLTVKKRRRGIKKSITMKKWSKLRVNWGRI